MKKRKHALGFYFLLLLSLQMQAQSEWSISVETALQQGYFKWPERIVQNQSIERQKQIGFSIGGSVAYQFAKQWSVHSGLFWTERGGRMEESSINRNQHSQSIVSTITTNYLELPIGITYSLPTHGYWRPHVRLSMATAIGVSGFEEISTQVANAANGSSESQLFRYIEYGNNYQRMNHLLSLELGLTRLFPKHKGISFRLRYQHGLHNIVRSPESGLTQLTDLRHRAFGFVLAYQFGLRQ